jgi:hypothetical protein
VLGSKQRPMLLYALAPACCSSCSMVHASSCGSSRVEVAACELSITESICLSNCGKSVKQPECSPGVKLWSNSVCGQLSASADVVPAGQQCQSHPSSFRTCTKLISPCVMQGCAGFAMHASTQQSIACHQQWQWLGAPWHTRALRFASGG